MKLRNILCWLKLGKLTFISISAKTIAACVALKHSPDMLPGYWQQHVLHIITLCGKIGCSKYSNTANPCKHASSFNKPLKCHSGFKLSFTVDTGGTHDKGKSLWKTCTEVPRTLDLTDWILMACNSPAASTLTTFISLPCTVSICMS